MNTINQKTRKYGIALFTSMCILTTQAQEARSVGEFNGIKSIGKRVDGDVQIFLTQSEKNSVKVDAGEKTLPKIKTEVKEGILIVDWEESTNKSAYILVEVKSLNSLVVSGNGAISSKNQLICDTISIEVSGTARIVLDIKANEIKTKSKEGNDNVIYLNGSTQMLVADIAGRGDLHATKLDAEKVKIKISGSGSANINVKQSLNADISGSGSVFYKGNPVEHDVNISGTGSVRESKSGEDEGNNENNIWNFKLGKKGYSIMQDEHADTDTDKSNYYDEKDSIYEYNEKYKNWKGIELGINGFLDYKNTLNLPLNANFLELNYARSFQVGVNLFEKDFHIYKNYFNLVTGLGFDFNHYAFANKITLNPDASYLSSNTTTVKFDKNTLNVSYIKVPLMLDFNTSKSPDKNFHLSAGVEFAYRIHSVTKQKFEVDGNHYKNKQRDDYNLEPFCYNAMLRIGYNNVTVFANYGLNRLFQKNKGPQVYPFTLGIAWSI